MKKGQKTLIISVLVIIGMCGLVMCCFDEIGAKDVTRQAIFNFSGMIMFLVSCFVGSFVAKIKTAKEDDSVKNAIISTIEIYVKNKKQMAGRPNPTICRQEKSDEKT